MTACPTFSTTVRRPVPLVPSSQRGFELPTTEDGRHEGGASGAGEVVAGEGAGAGGRSRGSWPALDESMRYSSARGRTGKKSESWRGNQTSERTSMGVRFCQQLLHAGKLPAFVAIALTRFVLSSPSPHLLSLAFALSSMMTLKTTAHLFVPPPVQTSPQALVGIAPSLPRAASPRPKPSAWPPPADTPPRSLAVPSPPAGMCPLDLRF